METLERKKKDGLGRRTINGIAFRNRDMLSERLKLDVKENSEIRRIEEKTLRR